MPFTIHTTFSALLYVIYEVTNGDNNTMWSLDLELHCIGTMTSRTIPGKVVGWNHILSARMIPRGRRGDKLFLIYTMAARTIPEEAGEQKLIYMMNVRMIANEAKVWYCNIFTQWLQEWPQAKQGGGIIYHLHYDGKKSCKHEDGSAASCFNAGGIYTQRYQQQLYICEGKHWEVTSCWGTIQVKLLWRLAPLVDNIARSSAQVLKNTDQEKKTKMFSQ